MRTKERFIDVCLHHGTTEFVRYGTRSHKRCAKCASEAVQKRRNKLKGLAVEYKGGKCSKCGYSKCVAALDFHHVDPKQKDFALSGKGITRSWKSLKQELDKCILVCANCHREIHENERNKTA